MNMKNIKKLLFASSAVLVLAACGNTNKKEAPKDTTDKVEQTDKKDNQKTEKNDAKEAEKNKKIAIEDMYQTDFSVSLDKALHTFRSEFGDDIQVQSVEFEQENQKYVYKMSGWSADKEHSMEIDAQSGEVFKKESEADDQEEALELEGIVTPQEAMKAAVKGANAKYATNWELDVENGATVYEVKLAEGQHEDVKVDAKTGEIHENN